ncbi:Uncharacterised protein [uncultured archaeon]|nr:Uncharacterised protein [uncultured archaeon]
MRGNTTTTRTDMTATRSSMPRFILLAFLAFMFLSVSSVFAAVGGITVNIKNEFGTAVSITGSVDYVCDGAAQTQAIVAANTVTFIPAGGASCNASTEPITITVYGTGDEGYIKWISSGLVYDSASDESVNLYNSANKFTLLVTMKDELTNALTGTVATGEFDPDATVLTITGVRNPANTMIGYPVPTGSAADTFTVKDIDGYVDYDSGATAIPALETGTQTTANSANQFSYKIEYIATESGGYGNIETSVASLTVGDDTGHDACVLSGTTWYCPVVLANSDGTIVGTPTKDGFVEADYALNGVTTRMSNSGPQVSTGIAGGAAGVKFAYKITGITTELGTNITGSIPGGGMAVGDVTGLDSCVITGGAWYCPTLLAHSDDTLVGLVYKDGYVQENHNLVIGTTRAANDDPQITDTITGVKYAYKITSIPTEAIGTELKATATAVNAGDVQGTACSQGGDTHWYCAVPLSDTTLGVQVTQDGYVEDAVSLNFTTDRTSDTDPQQTATAGAVKYAYKIALITTEGLGSDITASVTGLLVGDFGGSDSCTLNGAVWYCPVLLADSAGAIKGRPTLDGYVQEVITASGAGSRTTDADAQQTGTISDVKYGVKVTALDELGAPVTGATVSVGDTYDTSCTGVANVYYCVEPVAKTDASAKVELAGFVDKTGAYADRTLQTSPQSAVTISNVLYTTKVTVLNVSSAAPILGATVTIAGNVTATDGGAGDADSADNGVIYIAQDPSVLGVGPHNLTVSKAGYMDWSDLTKTIASTGQAAYTTALLAPVVASVTPGAGDINSTAVNSTVIVAVDGFTASSALTVRFNGTVAAINGGTGTTNTTGSALVNVTIPMIDVGTYDVNVTDADGYSATLATAFTVTDNVPPAFNLVALTDADAFVSSTAPNNEINLIVNATDYGYGATGILNMTANFSLLNAAGMQYSNTTINMTYNAGTQLWNATFTVTNVSALAPTAFMALNITVAGYDNSSNYAVGQNFTTVVLYNMTTPPADPTGCSQWDTDTTDLSTELNFSSVNYVLGVKVNVSCYMPALVASLSSPPAWLSQFTKLGLVNFTSLNMSDPAIGAQLALLPTSFSVNITPPGTFGESRIYFNTSALTAFSSNASVTMYHLPFTSEPTIVNDTLAAGLNGTATWVQGTGEGNLTFAVNGFSGYNMTDNATPIITVNAPANGAAFYNASAPTLINVTVNGTGTPVSQVIIRLNSSLAYVYNSTANTAGCTAVANGSEKYICLINASSLSNAVYVINVTAYDYGGNASPGNNATDTATSFTMASDTTPPVFVTAVLNSTYVATGTVVAVTVNATDLNGVASVTANGVALTHTGAGNASWNGTITLAGSTGAANVTVVATDVYGNVNTTYIGYTIDATSPALGAYSPMHGVVVTNDDGNLTLSWEILETNLTTTNASIDGLLVHTNSSNGTTVKEITGLSAGTHTLVIYAKDAANNAMMSTTNFTMVRPIDAANQTAGMQSATGLTNVTLKVNGTDESSNASLNINTTLELDMDANSSDTNITVQIPAFNGTGANWNMTESFNVTTDVNSSLGNTTRESAGSNITVMVLFTSMSQFLPESAYINGTAITFNATLGDQDVLYIADDAGTVVYKLGSCGGTLPSTVTLATMCYTNTSTTVTAYVPHLSGAALANDTVAPTVTLGTPGSGATIANSFFTLALNVTEANPIGSNQFCWYNITNPAGATVASWSGYLTTPTPVGVKYDFTKAITGLANGAYNATVNCTDLNNQSTQVRNAFTVADTTVPTVTAISAATSTPSVTLSVTTDEIAECRYSTSDVAFASMTALTTTNALTHSITISYGATASGTYYVRCKDVATNTMLASNSTAFSVTITAAVSSSNTPCTPSWSCTGLGTCSATGVQTRTCVDLNACGVTTDKPDEVFTCIPTIPCVESWTCGIWGACSESGYQTRTCGDSNHCGTSTSRPTELQRCNYTAPPVTGAESEAVEITGGAEVTIKTIAANGQQSISMPVLASTSTGVSKIVLTAKNAVSNIKLTVKTAQPNVKAPDGIVVKYLEITASNLNAGDLDKAVVSFEVAKSQVQNVARVRLARYTGGEWVMLTTAFVGETSDSYKFEAETPGFSYFAVLETTSPATASGTEGQQNLITPASETAAQSNSMVYFGAAIVLVILAAYWWYSQKKPWTRK